MKFDKFTDVCMTGSIRHPPSDTNLQLTFSRLILHLIILKLCRVTKVIVLFLVLVYVFNFNLFEFSAAILEKRLFTRRCICNVIFILKNSLIVLFLLSHPLLGGVYRLRYSTALGDLGRSRASRRDGNPGADRGQQILV